MKCDLCGCDNASYIVKESINGVTSVNHYCENCVTSKAKSSLFETYQLPFSHLFSKPDSMTHKKELTCPNCKLSLGELRKKGRFGCMACYETFKDILPYYLKRMQSGDTHVGKKDITVSEMTEERKLSLELETAIKEERYEDAAILRDKLRALKEADNEK